MPLFAFERKVRWANTAVLAANAWLWTDREGWMGWSKGGKDGVW